MVKSLLLSGSSPLFPTEAKGIAPAKINLALHVGGRRSDGLHRLASLVVFTQYGDQIQIRSSNGLSLEVSGPFREHVPDDGSNLVLRAAALIADGRGAAIALCKRIPAAAGLGGGSSDAAEVLRLLTGFWNEPLPSHDALMDLGADVPACLAACPAIVEGAGELVSPVDCVPNLHFVLVNPGVPISTGSVFRAFDGTGIPVLKPPPDQCSVSEFVSWLAVQRNDLEAVAVGMEPEIGRVLDRIRQLPGCLFARMSGSGATCFGIFVGTDEAVEAARWLGSENPAWWVEATASTPFSGPAVSCSG